MRSVVIFSGIVGELVLVFFPVNSNYCWSTLDWSHSNLMSMVLDIFCFIVWRIIPCAVQLSAVSGVGDCGCLKLIPHGWEWTCETWMLLKIDFVSLRSPAKCYISKESSRRDNLKCTLHWLAFKVLQQIILFVILAISSK